MIACLLDAAALGVKPFGEVIVWVAFTGFIAVMYVGLRLVLTGVVGLSIDMGYLRYTKRRLQTAADSAAVARASELQAGNYRAAALNDSKSNGFEDGVSGTTVKAFNPPKDAPFAGKVNDSSRCREL